MKAIGCHILAELSHCNKDSLCDVAGIKDIMVRAALEAKAEIRETAFHKFSPYGVSGVVVIAESHLSIHTWPELGYAAIDIYTCGDTTEPWRACYFIAEKLDAQDISVSEVKRGIPNSRGYFSHAFSKTHMPGGLKVVQSA
ncbi:MAG: adenosylmethionine decarboxylase [Candidatus Eremiobacteraeota bacterium]|nr:adenosylmethionine decarboxylase [Candidatus Eremiobacteraeota bacterium]